MEKHKISPNALILTSHCFQHLMNELLSRLEDQHPEILKSGVSQIFGFGNYDAARPSLKAELQKNFVGVINGKYLYDKKGFSKIAVFYQNDEYGQEGYIGVINTLKKYNLSLVAQGSYKRNTLSIRHAFHAIENANPEAIIMVGANKANSLSNKSAKFAAQILSVSIA